MEICKKEECTACSACINICPKSAIRLIPDKLNRTIALIDDKLCINCGLCVKSCPNNLNLSYRYPKRCYAAWSRHGKTQKHAASGGVATEFYNYAIQNDGICAGVKYTDSFELEYEIARDETSLHDYMGSQYVQANVGDIYRRVKTCLRQGKMAVFVGTPCQVAGLKAFLGEEYDNLITVDIVCHGVPPFQYLKEYMGQKTSNLATKASFRGINNFFLTFYKDDTVLYKKSAKEDEYFIAFLDALTYRSNCYFCRYARPERVSDITIGDFWGLDRNSLKIKCTGRISCVLINTEKGEGFWEKVSSQLEFEERKIEEALSYNGQLTHPSQIHQERNWFEEKYLTEGFAKAVMTKSVRDKIISYKMSRTIPARAIRKIKEYMNRG